MPAPVTAPVNVSVPLSMPMVVLLLNVIAPARLLLPLILRRAPLPDRSGDAHPPVLLAFGEGGEGDRGGAPLDEDRLENVDLPLASFGEDAEREGQNGVDHADNSLQRSAQILAPC